MSTIENTNTLGDDAVSRHFREAARLRRELLNSGPQIDLLALSAANRTLTRAENLQAWRAFHRGRIRAITRDAAYLVRKHQAALERLESLEVTVPVPASPPPPNLAA